MFLKKLFPGWNAAITLTLLGTAAAWLVINVGAEVALTPTLVGVYVSIVLVADIFLEKWHAGKTKRKNPIRIFTASIIYFLLIPFVTALTVTIKSVDDNLFAHMMSAVMLTIGCVAVVAGTLIILTILYIIVGARNVRDL